MSDSSSEHIESTLPHKLAAFGVIALGLAAAWQSTLIPQVLYTTVGPSVFAWFVAGFLLVLGALLLVAAFRGGWAADQEGTLSEWGSLGWVTLGLVLNVVLIEWIGFILSSTLLFACVARGFGSRKLLRDAAIGFGLALISYVGFDRILGYKIGSGLIEKLF
ncbi:MAG: tripartite tricarboxylate transporter TctB family protein [Methylobacterium sp.]|jgi:putative tricarboxylic transport membrane protein|nr:tripartite tricarboxylate transporter TctB family protein [Methylobacterium sp.]MCE2932924.1 tripartite tricarboxylate transporter TctB family protein [Hyphomicrobiales bacterium]MCZ8270218.1 tripartite tricarboxylate transporter TctB family protein [Beijerinckiaceae bacterium]MCA3654968.1 tripartite tricarboxylate transporter TctB family protein [Methylobacterium sp.]MCA3657408.1 tripartite tricarboxylate transporter TctB family protein [Methylobacterium sp.]